MTLPTTGAISFNDLQTELGGSGSISLNEYYAVRPLTSAPTTNSYTNTGAVGYLNDVGGGTTAIPSSYTISVNNFHGAQYPDTLPTNAYATPGTYTLTAPYLPTGWNSISMVVYAQGAGGGGGGAAASDAPNRNPSASGGGGGAGTLVSATYAGITAGATCTVVVGAGGAGGTRSTAANPYTLPTSGGTGGNSTVNIGATSVSAAGGTGGRYGQIEPEGGSPGQSGGPGGSIGGGAGSTNNGGQNNGGAGGASGLGAGGAAGVGIRYGSTSGGAGGVGAGGGGGGASYGSGDSGETAGNGGAGGAGYVTVRFIRGA